MGRSRRTTKVFLRLTARAKGRHPVSSLCTEVGIKSGEVECHPRCEG